MESKPPTNKLFKRFSLIYLLLLPIFLATSTFTSYRFHKSAIEGLAKSQRANIIMGDNRSAIDAFKVTEGLFTSFSLVDNAGKEKFKVNQTDEFPLFPLKTKYLIFSDHDEKFNFSTLVFEWDAVGSLVVGLFAWLISAIFILPIFIFQKNRFMIEYSDNLKIAKLNGFYDLARQVAHDIRSPISVINILAMGRSENVIEKKQILLNAVDRINNIANDLLRVSREHDFKVIKKDLASNVTTNGLSGKVVGLQKSKDLEQALIEIYDEKFIFLSRYPSVNLLNDVVFLNEFFIEVDIRELKRIISNLINNSYEALNNSAGVITLSGREYGDQILISVFDNGLGISEEQLKHIQEERFYASKSTSDSGNGIGLFHANQVLKKFNGKLKITSKINQGTCVDLIFNKVSFNL